MIATSAITDGIALLTIDSPPVNTLSLPVRRALVDGLVPLLADDGVKAIVLACAGRTFFAGADISEFGVPPAQPDFPTLFRLIDTATKPVIAAIHGTALGGGFELALICHYRIAAETAQVGLPEVLLGLMPGAGGTQWLPRLAGVSAALEIMTSGRHVPAEEALALNLVDAVAPAATLVADALTFTQHIVADGAACPRIADRAMPPLPDPGIFDDFEKANARRFRGLKAPYAIIEAVRASTVLHVSEGLDREQALFRTLEHSSESRAQRYYFFAERGTSRIPDLPVDTLPADVRAVGIVGAGTMGGGIAMNFLNAGLPVTLMERDQVALDRGIGVIRRNYESSAAKGRMTMASVEQRMALITPALDLAALGTADLIIEAIYEDMTVKQALFARLDDIAKLGAIMASNTSFLDLDRIAAATTRPEAVIGLHFFSPANVMRLLEIVRGTRTAPTVIATAMQLAGRIGKIPVLSGVCDGFIANRLLAPRAYQADALALEGTTIETIDRALVDYGFAMGHFQMMDLVGLDVIGRDASERTAMGDLVAAGRLGQKQGGGYYDYDDRRRPVPSPFAAQIIAAVAEEKGMAASPTTDPETLLARLLYPIVNEGAKILEEGIALRAADIDVAAILGYNWPVHTGGPMFWAGSIGLSRVVAGLETLERRHGATFTPAPLLRRLAAEGDVF